jgi:hypothetical protein
VVPTVGARRFGQIEAALDAQLLSTASQASDVGSFFTDDTGKVGHIQSGKIIERQNSKSFPHPFILKYGIDVGLVLLDDISISTCGDFGLPCRGWTVNLGQGSDH